jgi:hypothetical protein
MKRKHHHSMMENPDPLTIILAIAGVAAVGGLGYYFYTQSQASSSSGGTGLNATQLQALGLPAPGGQNTCGSYVILVSSDGTQLTITDNSTAGNGAETNIPTSTLSGNLTSGNLATTQSPAPTVLANINNACSGTTSTTPAAGTSGLPARRRVPQLNPQLG